MNVTVCTGEALEIIELLGFVADLCCDQDETLDKALYRFVGSSAYAARELRGDATSLADRLARALGFADSTLEPRP
jgi:hypothetical protein